MRYLTSKLILFSLTIVASFLVVSVVYAQEGGPGTPSDNDVNRVAKQLYCPVCPNTPLDVCETKACEDWRAQIRDQLSRGWTDQQIIDYFVAQYGERVLAEPQRKGFTSLVWLLPVITGLLGLWITYEVLKGWRQKQTVQSVPMPTPPVPPEVLARIEQELRKMD